MLLLLNLENHHEFHVKAHIQNNQLIEINSHFIDSKTSICLYGDISFSTTELYVV